MSRPRPDVDNRYGVNEYSDDYDHDDYDYNHEGRSSGCVRLPATSDLSSYLSTVSVRVVASAA
jgi:hypothetical protein